MPHLHFRFIGDDSFSPEKGMTMKEYILRKCALYAKNIEFTGKVSLTSIGHYLGETDIVICNSLWENYPTVILEAMSAGRVVIATRAGGISEIISFRDNGLLVNKRNPAEVVRTILWCYRHMDKMARIGFRARTFMLKYSSEKELVKLIEDQYKQMIRPL
jgi:glycosyltransferase involved in cell wall biosynthesis